MTIRVGRVFLLSSSALIVLCSFGDGVGAQESSDTTVLPEVRVSAPSPIQRRRPARPSTPSPTQTAAPAAPAETPPAPLPGTLPIVTDQFATVTVVPNEEIRRNNSATLGDLLFSKPGITGSSFAPGASSRPIIRGLDVNRVGIVENGVNGGGASDLGEDHFVPIDPLTTNQIEVIRGPAALRWGSTAIGGVVSATNNRIPDALPCVESGPLRTYARANAVMTGVSQRPCVSVETRGAATTVDNGLNGGILLDAGHGNFAMHADAFGRQADDYRIPSYPYLFPPDPAPVVNNGRQPNSAMRSNGESVGGSYVFDQGFIGLAVIQNNTLYHIPGLDGADHNTRINAHQTKVDSKGEWRSPSPFIDAVRFWAGVTDYKHNEIGLADPTDPSTDGIRQTFTNQEQEGRGEIQLAPFDLRFATLTTAVGVQGGHQRLTAPGDTPGPDSGLWDPNTNTRVAGYIFNEFKFTESFRAQIAGRIESVKLNGTMPNFPSDFLPDGTPLVASPRNPQFTPKSAAIGFLQDLPWNLVASLTAQYVQRAPKPAELFSRGPHDATGTFDIGDPNLKIEVAKSIEAGLRRATGPFRFELTGYVTKFEGFIFRNLTGVKCDATFDTCGAPDAELNQAVYSQRDALFRGMEFQSQLDVVPLWSGMFGIENQFDLVRATFTDGTNVPRIPPVRVGGGVFWRDPNWLVRLNLLHAFAHNDVEVTPTFTETPTAGYNLLKAEVSYKWKARMPRYDELSEFTVGVVGDNLLNDNIRNSVSYTKDEVLMPGLGVRVFANVKY
jgi:iron complex outermembrane receptor protein